MNLGTQGSSKNLNMEDLLRLGARTAQDGNRKAARVIFQQVLDTDKRNERAWLWMAYLADNDLDRRRYLETVLQLDPGNAPAAKKLAEMDQAVKHSEGISLRFGIMIVVVLVLVLLLVAGLLLLITGVH